MTGELSVIGIRDRRLIAGRWLNRAEAWLARGFFEPARHTALTARKQVEAVKHLDRELAAIYERAQRILELCRRTEQPTFGPLLKNVHQQEWNGHNLTFGPPNLKPTGADYIKAEAAARAEAANRKQNAKVEFAVLEENGVRSQTPEQAGEQ